MPQRRGESFEFACQLVVIDGSMLKILQEIFEVVGSICDVRISNRLIELLEHRDDVFFAFCAAAGFWIWTQKRSGQIRELSVAGDWLRASLCHAACILPVVQRFTKSSNQPL